MNRFVKWLEILAFPLLIVLLLTLYFINENRVHSSKSVVKIDKDKVELNHIPKYMYQFKKDDIFGAENTIKYIEYVINNGSKWLGYKGGVMEGGYISSKDAHMVACYVLELSGRKSPTKYSKDAQMYYSSVCAGCHGNDGKGLHGNYPDLTKQKLEGLKRLYSN